MRHGVHESTVCSIGRVHSTERPVSVIPTCVLRRSSRFTPTILLRDPTTRAVQSAWHLMERSSRCADELAGGCQPGRAHSFRVTFANDSCRRVILQVRVESSEPCLDCSATFATLEQSCSAVCETQALDNRNRRATGSVSPLPSRASRAPAIQATGRAPRMDRNPSVNSLASRRMESLKSPSSRQCKVIFLPRLAHVTTQSTT